VGDSARRVRRVGRPAVHDVVPLHVDSSFVSEFLQPEVGQSFV
jgi:spore cortex formation protein SpoVR/YcgB (stage V sporulation)